MDAKLLNLILDESLKVLIPILVGMAILAGKSGLAYLRAKVGAAQFDQVQGYVRMAVQYAEQSGLAANLEKAGADKKAIAVKVAQSWLDANHIPLDADQLDHLIESLVQEEYGKDK